MKNKRSKLIISFLCSVILITLVIFFFNGKSRSNKENENSNNAKESMLDVLIGKSPEPKLILDAAEISASKIDYEYTLPIKPILDSEEGYEGYYESMVQLVKNLCESAENYPFYQEEGFYVSTVPIYYFDAYNNTLSIETHVLLFSKDMSKTTVLIFFTHNNELQVQVLYPFDSYMEKLFQKEPDEKYIFLFNANDNLIIGSDNELYTGISPHEFEVVGDYYHALDYEKLGVSYAELTDADNLVWIDISTK